MNRPLWTNVYCFLNRCRGCFAAYAVLNLQNYVGSTIVGITYCQCTERHAIVPYQPASGCVPKVTSVERACAMHMRPYVDSDWSPFPSYPPNVSSSL